MNIETYNQTCEYIKSQIGDFVPNVGVVLGSGLGAFADNVNSLYEIDYKDIPHFPVSTVKGHAGKLIFGTIGTKNVVVMKGRFHYYEGYELCQVTYPIRIMKMLGVHTIMLSNAAGGLNNNFNVGDMVMLRNHISFIPNPLLGTNIEEFGERFPEMKEPYDTELMDIAEDLCPTLKRGVYMAVTGPSLETASEIEMYKMLGGDMIGMSTAPECVVARHCAMRVFAVSIITNSTSAPTDHNEVVRQGDLASRRMSNLFVELIKKI